MSHPLNQTSERNDPSIRLSYIFEMPNRWTFSMPKVWQWLSERMIGRVLNVFCGQNKIPGAVNCDIDQTLLPDYVIDAMELGFWFKPMSFDTAVIDPPYSFHQAVVQYNGHDCQKITAVKDHLARIVRGRLIWFGWNIPRTEGFVVKEIMLVGHGGNHNATICTVEDRDGTNIPATPRRFMTKL